jgi:hypothetical protein
MKQVKDLSTRIAFAAVAFLIASGWALAAPQETEEVSPPASGAEPSSSPEAVVTGAFHTNGEDGAFVPGSSFTFNDVLVLEVENLVAWLGSQNEKAEREVDGCDLKLYLNGRVLTELEPVSCEVTDSYVHFDLWQIDRNGEEAWRTLLKNRKGFTASASVSIGFDDQPPLTTELTGSNAVVIHVVRRSAAFGALVLFLISLVFFLVLARQSNILRDSPSAFRGTPPYSLARCQMAWWFFVVLGCFLLLALITGVMPTIPGSVLSLIGIASATYLGAEAIGVNKPDTEEESAKASEAEEGGDSAPASKPKMTTMQRFLVDLLSGSEGIAFHRFQVFVWTIILGIVFIYEVWDNLVMPDFNVTLLGLMGISSGTYLGFKFPELSK